METLEQLKAKQIELIDKLRSTSDKSVLKQIRQVDAKIQDAKRVDMLNNHNAKQSKYREIALRAWNLEVPETDIFNQDGTPHGTKVKKYPNLAAEKYLRAEYEAGQITKVIIDGQKLNLCRPSYEYGKETEWKRFESFEDFLKYNSIAVSDITLNEFDSICAELEEANKQMKANIEAYEAKMKELGQSSLSYWSLLRQDKPRFYMYEPNN